MNNKLRDLLMREEPKVEAPETVAVVSKKISVCTRIMNYILRRHENEYSLREKNPFKPSFNEREEFAVWIRTEFPGVMELGKEIPSGREKEVYTAALRACTHGVRTADTCIRNYFQMEQELLKVSFTHQGYWGFNYEIRCLVGFIEELTPNLTKPEDVWFETIEKSSNMPVRDKWRGR